MDLKYEIYLILTHWIDGKEDYYESYAEAWFYLGVVVRITIYVN